MKAPATPQPTTPEGLVDTMAPGAGLQADDVMTIPYPKSQEDQQAAIAKLSDFRLALLRFLGFLQNQNRKTQILIATVTINAESQDKSHNKCTEEQQN